MYSGLTGYASPDFKVMGNELQFDVKNQLILSEEMPQNIQILREVQIGFLDYAQTHWISLKRDRQKLKCTLEQGLLPFNYYDHNFNGNTTLFLKPFANHTSEVTESRLVDYDNH